MKIEDIIKQPEGRRLELKEKLPSGSNLAKTVIAFSNDAGGEIYLGVKDEPREHVGLDPDMIIQLEEQGTYIRVGSSNRLAFEEIIAELERKSANKSFDSEIIFEERTGEELNFKILSKLRLYEGINGEKYPTSALILLSDDSLRYKLFPYAKIECARFKGTTPGNFIDRKTIDINTAQQAEIAFHRIDRWEYPIDAIREVVCNAIVHRDYALSGKDIKIISDDLKNYPEIELSWSEPGIAFRVTFSKKRPTPESAGKTMGEMSEKILWLINDNPEISAKELAYIINRSSRTIERAIAKLKNEGRIKRIGPDKGGYWEVIECAEWF